MITLAHDLAVLRIPHDSARLFGEPLGDYHVALAALVERVSDTNRRAAERHEADAR